MNPILLAICSFVFTNLSYAQSYKGPDTDNQTRFICHDTKIESVNFEFCSSENPRWHGFQATYDQKMKNVSHLQSGRFHKYNDCYIKVKENGKSRIFYDIKDTKPVCAPETTNGPKICETPEDTVRFIGSRCAGIKGAKLSDYCTIVLQHQFDLKGMDQKFVTNDTRRMCVCNSQGCGHLLIKIENKNFKNHTDQEKENYIDQIKEAFKKKTPECDDVVIKDVSASKPSIHMDVALSSAKCPIIYESIISGEHCPAWPVRGVERIEITRSDGKKQVVAAVCVKRSPQGYAPTDSKSTR